MVARLVRMLSCTPSIRNSFCFPSCDSRRGARRRIFPRWANASRARIRRHVRCRLRRPPPESRRRSKPPPGRGAPPPDWPGLSRPYPFSARSRAGPPGPLPAARATVSPARKTGVTAPWGRRVHGTRLNGSGTSAAASRASSTTTGSKHGVPCALSSVRSAAMSSPHSSAKPPRQRTAEGTENQTRGQQGPGAVRPRGAPPKPPAAPFDAAQICFESASSFCT